nr:DUF1294 domain-containing protein [Altererythrobacter epoxidivorans]
MTFAAFGLDKSLAEGGRSRISEATLLNLSLIGGTAGAYAGRQVFRHKTRKQPFSSRLHTIAVLQVVAAGLASIAGLDEATEMRRSEVDSDLPVHAQDNY